MADTLSTSLARLAGLVAELGSSPASEQLEQLRSICTAALTSVQGKEAGSAQQKQLWEAAASLWNASLDLKCSSGTSDAASSGEGAARLPAAAALLQAACDLCVPLAPAALLPQQQVQLVRFYLKAGQAWALQGEFEAAEAVLSRAGEAAAAAAPLALERRGRALLHQNAAAALSSLQLERVRVAVRLKQQALATELVSRAAEFAGDARLPPSECLALRLALIELLREEGKRLAKAGSAAEAAPLLGAAYDCLSQIDLDGDGGGGGEAGQLAAEVQAIGAQVLTLLAWCSTEAGEAERALSCLQALRQVAGPEAAAHFSSSYLSLRCLLQLGRLGEAQAELLGLVSHEAATPEACLAGLRAALQAPGGGGVALARAALTMVLERFSEDPTLVVELTAAALAAVEADGTNQQPLKGDAGGDAAMAADEAGLAAGAPAGEQRGIEEAEELVLELVGDDRLVESVCEASQGSGGGGDGGGASPRRQLVALLWNHGVSCLAGGAALAAAAAFFGAVLPLLERGGDGGSGAASQQGGGAAQGSDLPLPVVCRRSLALCCLGLSQHDRALEHLKAADQLEPAAVPTAMLRLTVCLAAGDVDGAAAAVASLATAPDADADVLRIACCQCLDAGAKGAARTALERLLARCAAAGAGGGSGGGGAGGGASADCEVPAGGLGAPGYEATVFQNLVQLLLDSPKDGDPDETGQQPASETGTEDSPPALRRFSELAAAFDSLVQRVQAVGAATFFALDQPGGTGRSQLEWLALQAWNAGQRAGAAGALQQAAVLLGVCGELHAALGGAAPAVLGRQKMAFLLAAASCCEVYEQQVSEAAVLAAKERPSAPAASAASPSPASASASLSLARSYLNQARAAATGLQTQTALLGGDWAAAGGVGAPDEAKSDVYLLLLEFKLACLGGDKAAQLAALDRARALPAFGASHFAMAAAMARAGATGGKGSNGGGGGGASGGGQEVVRAAEGARLHRLTQQAPLDYPAVAVSLRTLLELSPADADKLRLLGEAEGLLSAAPPAAYPQQELRWLVTTAWNRGAVHARFGRTAEAAAFQRWAAAALQYDADMAQQYKELMQEELERSPAAVEGHLCAVDGLGSLAI